MIDSHRVLFFMRISAAQDLVDDISLLCHQEKSLGILIKTSDRIDPLGIV